MEEINVLFLIIFVSLGQTPKIKICHMVASEHPEVVEGRRKLISMDVLDSEEADEDGSIDNNCSDLDEEDDGISGEADVGTVVTE